MSGEAAEGGFFAAQRARLVRRTDLQTFKAGNAADSFHSYDPREKERYASRINKIMQGDSQHSPLNPNGNDLFRVVGDGKWLCRFLNKCEPGTVDDSIVHRMSGGHSKKAQVAGAASFANVEIMNVFLEGCVKAGLQFGNVGSADFAKADEMHKEHLILGVVWQLLRRQLSNEIKEILRMEAEAAIRAAEEAGREVDVAEVQESQEQIAKAMKDPEVFMCEWVNETLKTLGGPDLEAAGGAKASSVPDMSTERSDVLARLAYAMAPSESAERALAAEDGLTRAEALVEWASEHGIPSFAQADDLRDTNPRLILPFVMSMFTWQHARKGEEAAAEAAAEASGGVVKHVDLKAVYVVRQHWHVPAAEDGSTAGSCTSNTICAFKAEIDALRYVLAENITLVGTDPELPHLLTLCSSYATSAGFTDESVQESLGPVPGLLEKPEDVETDDAEKLRARAEAWVKELTLSDLKHYQDLMASILSVGPAVKMYACDHAQIF